MRIIIRLTSFVHQKCAFWVNFCFTWYRVHLYYSWYRKWLNSCQKCKFHWMRWKAVKWLQNFATNSNNHRENVLKNILISKSSSSMQFCADAKQHSTASCTECIWHLTYVQRYCTFTRFSIVISMPTTKLFTIIIKY